MFDPLHYYDMGKAPARVQCGNIARGACREANTVQHDSLAGQTLTLARETI